MERNCALESYRFFAIGNENIVLWESGVSCWSDDEALATGRTLCTAGLKIEVWNVARFVGRCEVRH